MKYPVAPVSDVVDDYHGTPVADPYRKLEDADAPETRQWVEEQNALTASLLGQAPGREEIRERLTRLWNYERFGISTFIIRVCRIRPFCTWQIRWMLSPAC
jgi:prolyl oligopeptidase